MYFLFYFGHSHWQPTDQHVSDMDVSKVHGNPDPTGEYVVSTRIRVGRNIRGLGLYFRRVNRSTLSLYHYLSYLPLTISAVLFTLRNCL